MRDREGGAKASSPPPRRRAAQAVPAGTALLPSDRAPQEARSIVHGTRKFIAAAIAVTALTMAFTLPVAAHPVGEADEPNCLGQRVSHRSSHSPVHGGHGLSPVERRDLVEELFGEDIPNLGLWIKFVKQCLEPPFEEPPI